MWQRSHSDAKIKAILRNFEVDQVQSSLPSGSQLAMAIAHQRQIQHQLEQQIETYKQILQVAPVGYLQVDEENQLIWCNPKARELLSISAEQSLKPRLLLELVRSYELDELIDRTRNAGKPCRSDWVFHPVDMNPASPAHEESYALRGYGVPLSKRQVGIFLENYQETVTLMQQRDRWASDVAHELKTPLTSIRLVAETLQTRLEPPLRGWVDRLINETIRLSNLVQDLLDLSQIDRDSYHCLQLKTVDLVELIHSAWINLEPLARKKQLQLHYDGPPHLLIQIDEPRMYRVLINLLDNGIKYSPPRQKINVRVSVEDANPGVLNSSNQAVCLEIIDAGFGFPEHSIPHVFERFYRADPSRTRHLSTGNAKDFSPQTAPAVHTFDSQQNHGSEPLDSQHRSGSGLGLAIVRQIVEAHQGSVSADNHPETGGAWLTIRLPWKAIDPSL